MRAIVVNIILASLLMMTYGCSQYLSQPLTISEARLGAETPQFKELTSLPQPREKIVAAVYKFRDQTGQYKDSDAGASWSTAVTQGATSILLRAMEESKWFIPIEREGLSNLLNERKIIRSSMANYNENDNNQLLPPLVFAGIIMEGGIISFDSNLRTGGMGARYFGTGASGEYREDRVTIYLRAVSTSNGRILKTVYTSKTILSQQVGIGVFRFVSTRRLLEAETGFTYNEPGEMAVKEAIEKAVFSLVIEGIKEGLWNLKNEEDANADIITRYVAEKDANEDLDVFGTALSNRRSRLGVGIKGTGHLFEGDYQGNHVYPGGELTVEYLADRPISYGFQTGLLKTGTGDEFNVKLAYTEIGLKYRFINRSRTSPYIRVAGGMVLEIENSFDNRNSTFPQVSTEFGMEYLITNKIGLNGALSYRLIISDNVDRLTQGRYDDSIWGANLGIMYYLFK